MVYFSIRFVWFVGGWLLVVVGLCYGVVCVRYLSFNIMEGLFGKLARECA